MANGWLPSRHSFITYGINQISVDKHHLTGLFFADLFNDLMDTTKMNITYVEERISGSCSDSGGNFTGILNSLYTDQADWTIMPFAELNCTHTQEFTYGTVFMDTKNTLVHLHPRIDGHYFNDHQLDIIADIPFGKTARAVDVLIYFTFWFLIVLSGLIGKWYTNNVRKMLLYPHLHFRFRYRSYIARKLLSTAVHILQIFARQGFNQKSKRISVRLLWILFTVHAFVASTVHFSFFKTNLFKPRQVTRLNNLHDLAISNDPAYNGRLPIETNTWKLFASAKKDPMKSIWERANKTGEALLHYSHEFKHFDGFMSQLRHENWAIISHFNNNRFLMDAYCLIFERPDYSQVQLYHSKETFLHSPTGIVFRKNFDEKFKRKITSSISKMSQSGFHDYYDKNPQGLLRKFPVQLRCYRMLHETTNLVAEEKVSKLSLVHYRRLLQIISGLIVIAFVALLYELKLNKLMNQQSRKLRTTKIRPAKKSKRPNFQVKVLGVK